MRSTLSTDRTNGKHTVREQGGDRHPPITGATPRDCGDLSVRRCTLNPMDRFSPATRQWFDGAFPAPTSAQLGAWAAIAGGEHTLVIAPTGSGKTLSAFLWAIDGLAQRPPAAAG